MRHQSFEPWLVDFTGSVIYTATYCQANWSAEAFHRISTMR